MADGARARPQALQETCAGKHGDKLWERWREQEPLLDGTGCGAGHGTETRRRALASTRSAVLRECCSLPWLAPMADDNAIAPRYPRDCRDNIYFMDRGLPSPSPRYPGVATRPSHKTCTAWERSWASLWLASTDGPGCCCSSGRKVRAAALRTRHATRRRALCAS